MTAKYASLHKLRVASQQLSLMAAFVTSLVLGSCDAEPPSSRSELGDSGSSKPLFDEPLPEPDPAVFESSPTRTMAGVELFDPSHVLDARLLRLAKLAGASAFPGATLGNWSFEPSGVLPAPIFVRIELEQPISPESDVLWWTYDDSRRAWFVQSIAALAEDGRTLTVALKHFSSHLAAAVSIHNTPPVTDKVKGTCDELVAKMQRGVVDADGTRREGDCGYTTFTPLFSGLRGEDYTAALLDDLLEPPFKVEYFDGHPTKDSGRHCARLYDVKLELSARVEVSHLDWTERQPKTRECEDEWRRLRKVITAHEAKHAGDAGPVIAAAQNRANALNVVVCDNDADRNKLNDLLGAAARSALTQLDRSIVEDWNARVHKLDGETTDRCYIDCSKCRPSCKDTGCPAQQTCCGTRCISECKGCQQCDEKSEECRDSCVQGQTCCGNRCIAPCVGCDVCDPRSSSCMSSSKTSKADICKPRQRVFCACTGLCYDDATTCLGECHTSLGCFTGICGPASADQCAD